MININNIRNYLNWNDNYYKINREERNLAAIFYHLLLKDKNMKMFLNLIGCNFEIIDNEFSIYFEYAYLRDLWATIKKNDKKRELIYKFLKIKNINVIKQFSIEKFNEFFGARPKASKNHIQSPSTWSIKNYTDQLDDQDFLEVCKFKWAFKAKPDIVIHTSYNNAICIETKLFSSESSYPSNKEEKKYLKKRT